MVNSVFVVQSDLEVLEIEKPGGDVVTVLVTATVARLKDEDELDGSGTKVQNMSPEEHKGVGLL